jgi:RND family efflux transporter MFP subunit
MQKTLHARGNTSDNRLDEAHLAWLQSTSVLLDARRARQGALAVTPIDGIVVAKHIDLHDELAPGSPTFTVADLTRMRVTVGVPEGDIAGVQELTSAELRVASAPGRVWEGRPVSLARQRSASTLSFAVEILVDNPEGALLSGATAHVRLALRSHENRIVVPSSALVSEGNESYVFVVNSPTVRRLPVTLGPSDDTRTVLLEGVSPGDEVIVTGMNQVREGDTVRVRTRRKTGTAAGKRLAEQSEKAILPEAGR